MCHWLSQALLCSYPSLRFSGNSKDGRRKITDRNHYGQINECKLFKIRVQGLPPRKAGLERSALDVRKARLL